MTVTPEQTRIVQLPARARRFDATDPAARADALAGLLNDTTVRAFLSDDAVSSVLRDEQAQKKKRGNGHAP